MPKEVRRTTMQVISQVYWGEFRVRDYGATLCKNTINWYVALGMTYSNIYLWLVNFWVFLVKFDFASVGDDGESDIPRRSRTTRQIKNVKLTEISHNASKTHSIDEQVHGKIGARPHGDIRQQRCRKVCTSALPVADERDGRGEGRRSDVSF